MATLLEATLSITRDGTGDSMNVSGRVEFSAGEIRLGLSYTVHVFLVEVDEGLDRYTLDSPSRFQRVAPSVSYGRDWGERQPDGITRVARTGDADEPILSRHSTVITPSASGMVPFSVTTPIQRNHARERGNEELQAVVWVVPEVCTAMLTTNQVSINLT